MGRTGQVVAGDGRGTEKYTDFWPLHGRGLLSALGARGAEVGRAVMRRWPKASHTPSPGEEGNQTRRGRTVGLHVSLRHRRRGPGRSQSRLGADCPKQAAHLTAVGPLVMRRATGQAAATSRAGPGVAAPPWRKGPSHRDNHHDVTAGTQPVSRPQA